MPLVTPEMISLIFSVNSRVFFEGGRGRWKTPIINGIFMLWNAISMKRDSMIFPLETLNSVKILLWEILSIKSLTWLLCQFYSISNKMELSKLKSVTLLSLTHVSVMARTENLWFILVCKWERASWFLTS